MHNSAQRTVPIVFHESKKVVTELIWLCILERFNSTNNGYLPVFIFFLIPVMTPCNSQGPGNSPCWKMLTHGGPWFGFSWWQAKNRPGPSHCQCRLRSLLSPTTAKDENSESALWHLHASVWLSTGRQGDWSDPFWWLFSLILWISAFRAFQRNLSDSKSDTVWALLMFSLLPLSHKWILRSQPIDIRILLSSWWSSGLRVSSILTSWDRWVGGWSFALGLFLWHCLFYI